MAKQYDLTNKDDAQEYVGKEFNAGVTAGVLHEHLRLYIPNLKLATVEEWQLKARGFVTRDPPQTAGTQPTWRNYPNISPASAYGQIAHHQPASSGSRGGATTGVNPEMPPPNPPFGPFELDRFVLNNHDDGRDIAWIREQISSNTGFEFTLNDVIIILNRQGVNSFNVSSR